MSLDGTLSYRLRIGGFGALSHYRGGLNLTYRLKDKSSYTTSFAPSRLSVLNKTAILPRNIDSYFASLQHQPTCSTCLAIKAHCLMI